MREIEASFSKNDNDEHKNLSSRKLDKRSISNMHKISTLTILLKILIGCSCQKIKGKKGSI